MEEVLAAHPDVAECAVIGVADELKGQVPVGLRGAEGRGRPGPERRSQARAGRAGARRRSAPVAAFKRGAWSSRGCPKTRSRQDPARRRCAAIADGRDVRGAVHDRGPGDPRRDRRGASGRRAGVSAARRAAHRRRSNENGQPLDPPRCRQAVPGTPELRRHGAGREPSTCTGHGEGAGHAAKARPRPSRGSHARSHGRGRGAQPALLEGFDGRSGLGDGMIGPSHRARGSMTTTGPMARRPRASGRRAPHATACLRGCRPTAWPGPSWSRACTAGWRAGCSRSSPGPATARPPCSCRPSRARRCRGSGSRATRACAAPRCCWPTWPPAWPGPFRASPRPCRRAARPTTRSPRLANEIVATIPDDFVLALDDVHALDEGPVRDALGSLASDLPPERPPRDDRPPRPGRLDRPRLPAGRR